MYSYAHKTQVTVTVTGYLLTYLQILLQLLITILQKQQLASCVGEWRRGAP